ncbi:hypothetical protein ACFE04_009369 [Oxalis oulophora]
MFKQLKSLVDRGSNEEALKYLTKEINDVLRVIERLIDEQMGNVPMFGVPYGQLETEEALKLIRKRISDCERDFFIGRMGKGPIDWDPSDFDFDTPEIELDLHPGEKSTSL